MSVKWHFIKQHPQYKNREAMQEEFFASTSSAKALIRESFQNSLDAQIDKNQFNEPVKIRIYISGQEGTLGSNRADKYFGGESRKHFNAEGNGLDEVPDNVPCNFITIEDFNTSGLNGDVKQYSNPHEKNDFYYFFRAEGQSNKSQRSIGRWGVGKVVYPRASKLRTFYGFTIRSEDSAKYLVGQTILKCHEVDGVPYTPDGWFGKTGSDDQLLPCDETDDNFIKEFREDFKLQRKEEPGLSVVIPYYDEDEITKENIVLAVVQDYFYPILANKLYVQIDSPSESVILDSGVLSEKVKELEEVDDELRSQIELAKWGISLESEDFNKLDVVEPEHSIKWEEVNTPENVKDLQQDFQRGKNLAIRVPLLIKKKSQNDLYTHFDILLRRDQAAQTGRPVFIREGIIIPEVKPRKTTGVLSIVIAEHYGIAEMLGDAENPAHNNWHADSSKFKNKYKYGPSYLSFVKNSVSEILSIISQSSDTPDKTLLADIFPLPANEGYGTEEEEGTRKKGNKPEVPPEDIPAPKPKRFKVNKLSNGFSIIPGKEEIDVPAQLRIKVFYGRQGGKPKYDPADFRLDNKKQFKFEEQNIQVIYIKDNVIVLQLESSDWRFTCEGFDTKRDLLVKPKIEEEVNATA